jgi:hypothetical protein
MLGLILKWLSGGALTAITGVFEAYFNKKITEEELKVQLGTALAAGMTDIAKTQGDVIKTELTGQDWLQRNWRAILATTSFFSYWFVIFAYPFFLAWGWLPSVKFGEVGLENMFYLTVVCVGGYIGGKSVENIVAALTRYVVKK